jgi:hypothetical protein
LCSQVAQRHDKCVAALLSAGADAECIGGGQRLTPYLLACKNTDWGCVSLLVDAVRASNSLPRTLCSLAGLLLLLVAHAVIS